MAERPSSPTCSASRSEGARVGAAIGLFGLAIALVIGAGWLAAAVVAGPCSGAWSASRIVPGKRPRALTILGAAGVATLSGAGTVALWMAIVSAPRDEAFVQLVGRWLGTWLFGLFSAGWIAVPALVPIAWLGSVILSNRSAARPARPDGPGGIAWLAGVVVGVGAGVLSLSIPVIGWEIAVAWAIGAVLSRATASAIGGFLVGGGGSWTALILAADARCAADTGIGGSCTQPDVTPWLAAGFGMLVVGLGLSLWAAVKRDPTARDGSSTAR